MSIQKKKILLFTEFSKKKGKGHFYRLLQIHKSLKKKFDCKIFYNKSLKNISFILKKNKHDLIVYDFKKYTKSYFKYNSKYIAFDNKKKFHKNLININPLTLSNNYFCGPNWYPYPPDFFLKKKKKKNFFILF